MALLKVTIAYCADKANYCSFIVNHLVITVVHVTILPRLIQYYLQFIESRACKMHILRFTLEIQFGADTSIASRYHHALHSLD